MKSIPQAKDLVKFVTTAEFYNKIQITSEGTTKTLWYLNDEKKWISGSEDGTSTDITEDQVVTTLQNLSDDSGVVVAGNSVAGILVYKF